MQNGVCLATSPLSYDPASGSRQKQTMSSEDQYIMSTSMPDVPLDRGTVRGEPPRNFRPNNCEQISVTAGAEITEQPSQCQQKYSPIAKYIRMIYRSRWIPCSARPRLLLEATCPRKALKSDVIRHPATCS